MSRRGKILIAIPVVAVLVALIVWWFSSPATVFDRTYEGRDLRAWAVEFGDNEDNPPTREPARAAIRVLCSNSLPELVKALDYDTTRSSTIRRGVTPPLLRYWVFKYFPWVFRDQQEERASLAISGLAVLGAEAAPAIPQITNLLASTKSGIRLNAFMVLPMLGTNGFSFFLANLGDDKHPPQPEAAEALYLVYEHLGTNEQAALMPVLVKWTRSADSNVAVSAAQILGLLKLDPEVSVAALIAAMNDSRNHVREMAIESLDAFGTNATAAIPALTRAREDTNFTVRVAATNALQEIQKRDE